MQTLADVDSGRADLNAQGAIDTTPEIELGRISRARARATRLAATLIVGDRQSVAVKHRALKSSVRAHVLADLFAHETRVAPGRNRIKQHPEQGPSRYAERQDFSWKFSDRFEVTNEGETREQCNSAPSEVFGSFSQELLKIPGSLVELHSSISVTFEATLDPEKNLGVHGLRACVTAPEATCNRGKQKKGERAHDQQASEVNKILRPEDHAEQIELARAQIE